MSVDLVRFDGDWNDENSRIIYSYPVAAENFQRLGKFHAKSDK